MKKYTVYYLNTYKQGSIEEYWQKIKAESAEQAYEKFIEKVGIFPRVVHVDSGLMKSEAFDSHLAEFKKFDPDFDSHLAEFKKIETEKDAVDAKESFNEQISEITEKQGLNKPESSTEKLLIKIIDLQQNQSVPAPRRGWALAARRRPPSCAALAPGPGLSALLALDAHAVHRSKVGPPVHDLDLELLVLSSTLALTCVLVWPFVSALNFYCIYLLLLFLLMMFSIWSSYFLSIYYLTSIF